MDTHKKISKLISYWLRHHPEELNLKVDYQGWILLQDLINELSKKGYQLSTKDIITLNHSFDKVRWEFSIDNQKIRATHGHSIPVDIANKYATPPEFLYHGTAISNIFSIVENGLSKMNRNKLHLSENIEDAIKIGKRHGKPFIIEIFTEDLIEDGWQFQKSENNIWLTDNIPAKYLSFEPWEIETSEKRKAAIINELKREIGIQHQLYQVVNDLKLIWTTSVNDDELFLNEQTGECYMIHLTWRGTEESDGYPSFEKYKNLEEWIQLGLYSDHKMHYDELK